MNYRSLFRFLLWNTIFNGGILLLWTVVLATSADLIYDIHGQLFSLSRASFDTIIYSLLGLYKILIFVFNVAPLIGVAVLKNQDTP